MRAGGRCATHVARPIPRRDGHRAPHIEMTKLVIETAKPLGISVHDHIIIGRHDHASMKGLGLIA
jgi:DNA repair protein RadC